MRFIDPSGHEGACPAGSWDANCDMPWSTADSRVVQDQGGNVTLPPVTVTAPRPAFSFSLPGSETFTIDRLAHHAQLGLEVLGWVPALNTPAGLTHAAISTWRGRYGEAGLTALTAIPMLGTIGKVGQSAEAVLKHLESILKPGGKLIGEAGSRADFRVLAGDIKTAEDLALDLARIMHKIPAVGWKTAWIKTIRNSPPEVALDRVLKLLSYEKRLKAQLSQRLVMSFGEKS